jgi:hypothetical protein
MKSTKRQMLLIPEVKSFIPEFDATTFVYFYECGEDGTSWTIRDYSIEQPATTYSSQKYTKWTAEDIKKEALYPVNARRDGEKLQSIDNYKHWHKRTIELNCQYGIEAGSDRAVAGVKLVQASPTLETASALMGNIPVLNLEQLRALPKNRKRGDMDRILHSPDSEDWVTWNFFQILLAEHPVGWWDHILSTVRRRNPDLVFTFDDQSPPLHELWKLVRSPSQYEVPSRARMRASERPTWISRANDPRPVEGPSEIDIAVEHDKFVVFIEAKLGSDISMETTYDPQRNQIIRNIDCLIEIAGERVPIFWLLVRDQKPARAYVQLMNSYRSNPGLLARELPHRSAETLNRVAQNLTVLVWSDFKELVCQLGIDPQTDAVKRELERRILGDQSVGSI